MNIKDAQNDMRRSYLGGGPGAVISGIVWLTAGILAFYTSALTSILVFFFGGMLIHPLGIAVSKYLNRSGKHKKENPLALLALESTLLLFIGLLIAYVIFYTKPEWFFAIMLMIIGVRYVLFQSIYGMKIYWVFGLVLTVLGVVSLLTSQSLGVPAIAGGVTELLFATLIFRSELQQPA